MSIKSKFYKYRRIASPKVLPEFVYRMDDRPVAVVKLNGLQAKGFRTDGAPGQFGPAAPEVTLIEHVKKTKDKTGVCINPVDPWVSFFAWNALQPISDATLRFMQGYLNGRVYMVDTATVVAKGYNFRYANEEFDLKERRSEGAQYRGQKEWSFYGTVPAASIRFFLPVPVLMERLLNGTSAPAPMTLPWTGM